MKPAFSVIFFTVSSGAGLGLFALLVLADLLGFGDLGRNAIVVTGIVALALVAAGLISSTFHLANPKNAWRAFSQFKRSWLSREGVFSLAFFPVALGYLACVHLSTGPRGALGIIAVLLAWVVLYCTGMIYACLKTIPQWHTQLTPLNYVLLGHASGALLLVLAARIEGANIESLLRTAVLLLAIAAGAKGAYLLRARRVSAGISLGPNIGMTAAQAKLLDVGHSRGTFLTREFVYEAGRQNAPFLRFIIALCAFAVPLIVLAAIPGSMTGIVVAVLACFGGLLVERWLFFAEAQHVVRLFHGQSRV